MCVYVFIIFQNLSQPLTAYLEVQMIRTRLNFFVYKRSLNQVPIDVS